MAVTVKNAVRDMTTCSLVEIYQRLEGSCCSQVLSEGSSESQSSKINWCAAYFGSSSTLKIETIRSLETSVSFFQTSLHHIPEDSTGIREFS
jgi:hypothetical protein